MAAIPQGMFAARKVRANMNAGWEKSLIYESRQDKQQDKKNNGGANGGGQSWGRQGGNKDSWGSFPKLNQQNLFPVLDHPPAKYNSKLMNSIWGLYNRYSVHNFKKMAEDGFVFGQQQSANPAERFIPGTNHSVAANTAPPRGTVTNGMSTNGTGNSAAQNAPAAWETFLKTTEYRH